MPYPENLDHHFVVDPAKFDFYAMDCYRLLGEDRFAENLAHVRFPNARRFSKAETTATLFTVRTNVPMSQAAKNRRPGVEGFVPVQGDRVDR